ncbi:hypothetical protein F5B22DRAFT_623467 [Xylaria bambusicola]|uniref:uncharacterized protein n=1 Tax=Xylaria bambusicola TaxID=326684 RepID=UPI002008239A|nr:uncharacterized protein F5B22DRAFT_623467 [Xylaria bambusicola]KAI0506552.1 hypothetical protein F5B22DRAFT_623467 [Xylaria bambusicola]
MANMAESHHDSRPARTESNGAPEYDSALDTARRSMALTRDEFGSLPGLPRLEYRLMEHKMKLFVVSGLLIFEGSLLPIVLFYPLWYATSLRHGILFAIITSFFGLISGLEFAHRSWRLIHKNDKYRPLDGTRWRFDFTHWTLSICYTIMTGILIGASIPHEPLVRPLAIPVPLFFIGAGMLCIVTGTMSALDMKTACKVSSIPKGAPQPPYVLTAVEDVVGVDGGGARPFRRRLLERYKASKAFRRLIAELNWFWGIGSVISGAGTLAAVWVIPSQEIAYGVGWGEPLVFFVVWTAITVFWIRRGLRREKKVWADNTGEKASVESSTDT